AAPGGRRARVARRARARAADPRRPQRGAPPAAHDQSTRRSRAGARGRPSRGGRVGGAAPADDARRILEALDRVILGQQAATREGLMLLIARRSVLLAGLVRTTRT